MRRNIFGVLAATALAGVLMSAQGGQPQSSDSSRTTTPPTSVSGADTTTTVTGCLIQGSKPTVFILEHAKTATDAQGASGKSYVVASAAGSSTVNLKNELNHQVTITGAADEVSARSANDDAQSPAAAGQMGSGQTSSASKSSLNENLLPKLTARSISKIGDTCPATE